jgi:hypothetical protein
VKTPTVTMAVANCIAEVGEQFEAFDAGEAWHGNPPDQVGFLSC